MKIEFDLSTDSDVKYVCEVFKKFADLVAMPKVVRTPDSKNNMYFPMQKALTEDGFVAALQYIALTNRE